MFLCGAGVVVERNNNEPGLLMGPGFFLNEKN